MLDGFGSTIGPSSDDGGVYFTMFDVDAARLSGGVKRLVAFAMAAVVPGRLVMLDEPTNDVDPVRRRLLSKTDGLVP